MRSNTGAGIDIAMRYEAVQRLLGEDGPLTVLASADVAIPVILFGGLTVGE